MFALSRQLKFGARVRLLLPEVIVACRVSEGADGKTLLNSLSVVLSIPSEHTIPKVTFLYELSCSSFLHSCPTHARNFDSYDVAKLTFTSLLDVARPEQ